MLKTFDRFGAAVVVGSVLGFTPLAANASTVLRDFTVIVTSGPLSPETIHGSFAYDTSSITPGSLNKATGLLTALDFTFNGVTYTATTANTGFLGFDSTGALNAAGFGNNCGAGTCGESDGTDQWFVDIFDLKGDGIFAYSEVGFAGSGNGDVVGSQGVPEPATWAMLLAGFFGIGAMARRVRRSSRAALA